MQFLHNTNIDFLKYRRFWIALSFLVMAAGVVAIFFHGKLNLGIDFAGGTQLTLAFRQPPDLGQVRTSLEGIAPGGQVQEFGESNEILVRLPAGSEELSSEQLLTALRQGLGLPAPGQGPDVNRVDANTLSALLGGTPEAKTAAEAILAKRREDGIFHSWDDVAVAAGPEMTQALEEQAFLGDVALLGRESVGPQIGAELRQKAVWAVVLSLLGMLGYIWFRFELRFGIGAIAASLHDVLVTLGLFTFAGLEFNITTIAAFLTLVGYSVNDTVVLFDRVRDNMRQNPREPLDGLINRSINQTLSRTVLTSGTTLLAAGSLLVFGGEVLRGFAFVLTLGVIIGTYSSIYIASPFALLWESWFPQKRRAAQAPAVTPRPATRG